ncbi:DUF1134 domain-containing protein [Altererythrobacter sp. H2]|uniref:DUF1134 domain-containing protein n=1 Tax=Altererythrobacter sp. H2 TaxID=3108391 RepID=UPI000BCDF14F|nr:DUF1134 domain-containing protein [Altererythrobacter sp. H2]OZA93243.1 MAG: hypothetical protein B7X57_05680 [Erythrobacter sp. 34-65-8]WRK95433.1 DUF1134 domain-containing protein [Altererythrobacter sp. H2]
MRIATLFRRSFAAIAGAGALLAAPLAAQPIESMDPNAFAIDGDLAENPGEQTVYTDPEGVTFTETAPQGMSESPGEVAPDWADPAGGPDRVAVAEASSSTYGEDDLIGAAEGVFGKGAEGLAKMIQDLLKDQGQPNGYIVGREAGGAFAVGVRYGSGTLHHKVEGQRKVYWTGPSIGFDFGANASNTFVLVYNLHDSEELYSRFPQGEGQAYLIGGLTASYLRKDDVVLIPIRMGAGLRLGLNAGYMKFSKKQRWLPF